VERWNHVQNRYTPTVNFRETYALTKKNFYDTLEHYRKKKNLTIKTYLELESSEMDTYQANDLKILEDKTKWYPWQTKLYNLLFTEYGKVREADDRQIIFIQDLGGKSGKSKLIKYLSVYHASKVGLLNESKAGQMNSSISKIDDKRIFLVDLPRTESDQGSNDLMNVVESLKNGMCISNYYGHLRVKMTEPPHIVMCGNRMPNGFFTPDRWKIYQINNETKDWKDITDSKTSDVKDAIEINNKKLDLRTDDSEVQLVLKKQRIEKILGRPAGKPRLAKGLFGSKKDLTGV